MMKTAMKMMKKVKKIHTMTKVIKTTLKLQLTLRPARSSQCLTTSIPTISTFFSLITPYEKSQP
jgi:hypothetical protein